jgi:hypothetical protein
MENYSTSKQAADIVGITPEDIGVSEKNFVRKKELISAGKFDKEPLSSYGDNDFILLKDIQKGSFLISISLNSDVTSRASVEIDNGEAGTNASKEVAVGEKVVLKCNLLKEGDVFDGWYKGGEKVSSEATYSFTVENEVNLVAKILYLDVSPTSLEFEAVGGNSEFRVDSNVSWNIK